jgi:hypothetical protein
MIMATWTRKQQEREGSYLFAGQFYITQGVQAQLSMDEVLFIYTDVLAFVQEKGGIDYLQVFISNDGRKLFFIDNLNRKMLASGKYDERDNYSTLMLASEY